MTGRSLEPEIFAARWASPPSWTTIAEDPARADPHRAQTRRSPLGKRAAFPTDWAHDRLACKYRLIEADRRLRLLLGITEFTPQRAVPGSVPET